MPDQDFQPSQQDIADYLKSGQFTPPTPPRQPSAGEQLLPGLFGLAAPALGKAAVGAIGTAGKALLGKGAAALASMGGPLAEFSNLKNLAQYSKMKQAGETPEKIFDVTKWFEGPGGSPKFEISDRNMVAKPMPSKMFGVSRGAAQDFIDHPEFFRQYPSAKGVPVAVDPDLGSETEGMYETNPFRITLGGPAGETLTPGQQGTLLHELGGHYPDYYEMSGHGSSPESVRDHVIDLLKDKKNRLINSGVNPIDPQILSLNDHIMNVSKRARLMYRGIPGEAGARNVTDRYMRQNFGIPPENYPIGSDPRETSRTFQDRGIWLEPAYRMKRTQVPTNADLDAIHPSGYSLSMKNNPGRRVLPENIPPELRSMYDRLPVDSGHRNPFMAGEFKYPWKTEDLPRSMQRDWHRFGTYKDIPQDWLEALRQGK